MAIIALLLMYAVELAAENEIGGHICCVLIAIGYFLISRYIWAYSRRRRKKKGDFVSTIRIVKQLNEYE